MPSRRVQPRLPGRERGPIEPRSRETSTPRLRSSMLGVQAQEMVSRRRWQKSRILDVHLRRLHCSLPARQKRQIPLEKSRFNAASATDGGTFGSRANHPSGSFGSHPTQNGVKGSKRDAPASHTATGTDRTWRRDCTHRLSPESGDEPLPASTAVCSSSAESSCSLSLRQAAKLDGQARKKRRTETQVRPKSRG